MKIKQNKFWEDINKNQLSVESIENDFDTFKSSSINYKIALFNPEVNGIRYLKTLIYFMASIMSSKDEEWKILSKISNREVGSPISIIFNNESVCLDYLQAVQEYAFIDSSMSLSNASVLEIGAGYGRTAHTILSNAEITKYTIVDLDNALQLSKKILVSCSG